MSRFNTTGLHPQTSDVVDIAYGWDCVPGFQAGYFFQVYSRNPVDILVKEGILVNEGFLIGLSLRQVQELAKEWRCKLSKL